MCDNEGVKVCECENGLECVKVTEPSRTIESRMTNASSAKSWQGGYCQKPGKREYQV